MTRPATATVYRIRFRSGTPRRLDCGTFLQAIRAVRARHPGADFGHWAESVLPFSADGCYAGRVTELRLKARRA